VSGLWSNLWDIENYGPIPNDDLASWLPGATGNVLAGRVIMRLSCPRENFEAEDKT